MPKWKMDYLSMAMKHYPEIKKKMEESNLDIHKRDLLPFMDIFTCIMHEAYEKGYKDGEKAARK